MEETYISLFTLLKKDEFIGRFKKGCVYTSKPGFGKKPFASNEIRKAMMELLFQKFFTDFMKNNSLILPGHG